MSGAGTAIAAVAKRSMPASSKKALVGALIANLAIAATKFVVGAVTGSTVMIAEGIHSLVDTGNSGLMLFGGWRSRRGPDAVHPFGYGMELYFWSFVVAMVVFGGGGGLSIYEGVRSLLHPRTVTTLWPNYVVIGVAAIFEGVSLIIGFRELATYRREKRFTGSTLAVIRTSKNPAIFLTVLEDTAALVGLAIAAIGVTLAHFLAMPVFDGIASILIGVVLICEALLLGIECRGLIIGEAARPLVVAKIRQIVAKHADLGTIEELRTLQLGPEAILVFLRMAFSSAVLFELQPRMTAIASELKSAVPSIRDVFFDASSLTSAPTTTSSLQSVDH